MEKETKSVTSKSTSNPFHLLSILKDQLVSINSSTFKMEELVENISKYFIILRDELVLTKHTNSQFEVISKSFVVLKEEILCINSCTNKMEEQSKGMSDYFTPRKIRFAEIDSLEDTRDDAPDKKHTLADAKAYEVLSREKDETLQRINHACNNIDIRSNKKKKTKAEKGAVYDSCSDTDGDPVEDYVKLDAELPKCSAEELYHKDDEYMTDILPLSKIKNEKTDEDNANIKKKTESIEKKKKLLANKKGESKSKTSLKNSYTCQECGKLFRRSLFLKKHLKIYHKGRKCKCCNEEFTNKGEFKSHMESHFAEDKKKKIFTCEQCHRTFNTSSNIIRHLKTHVLDRPPNEKIFKCTQCDKSFTQNGGLKRHMRLHSGERPYKCSECGKCFGESSILKKHLKIHTGEKPFSCAECGKNFISNSQLILHKRSHTGECPYTCERCGKKFTANSNWRRHMRIHSGEKPFTCEVCGKCFHENACLRKHYIRNHSGEKPFKCDVCDKCFPEASSLAMHLRIHSGLKPYMCDECGKCFGDSGNLRQHIILHSGNRPFECEKCGKAFPIRSHLTRHLKIHTGIKPHKCTECGKCFTLNFHLTNHMRTHTGEKPFACTQCGKCFADRSTLRKHLRSHTDNKVVIDTNKLTGTTTLKTEIQPIGIVSLPHAATLPFLNTVTEISLPPPPPPPPMAVLVDNRLPPPPPPPPPMAVLVENRLTYKCDQCGQLFSHMSTLNDHTFKVHFRMPVMANMNTVSNDAAMSQNSQITIQSIDSNGLSWNNSFQF